MQHSCDLFVANSYPLKTQNRIAVTYLIILNHKTTHKGIEKSLPARHYKLIPENEKAIEIGKEILKTVHVL